ncbi:NUDIX domain-containing protein [bacterium]|nr:MAG: NUDIX domain-containing protein [bacterium]
MTRAGIYRGVGRIASPFALVGLRVWTFVTHQERSRVIVCNEYDEVLLVKGTISDWRWSLPGGGIEKNEDPLLAAVRELQEETGIIVNQSLVTKKAVLHKGEKDVPYTAHIYQVMVAKDILPSNPVNVLEVADIRWFATDALPERLSPMAQIALKTITKQQ